MSSGISCNASSEKDGPDLTEELNITLSKYLFIVCGAVSVAVIIWRVIDVANKYSRRITCLSNDRQRYFSLESRNLALFKRHILYAPILSKRHNLEIQLSSAVNLGTLPTRFQLLFLAAYLSTNVVFCVINIPFSSPYKAVACHLRDRSGVLAIVNMVPLFILAGRNNPLIPLLGISFDTYNLLHRWFGRIVVLESVLHTLAHFAYGGWTRQSLQSAVTAPSLTPGLIATCALVGLSLQAWSPLRHAFYETFKLIHISVTALAVTGLWYHLERTNSDHINYVYALVMVWSIERLVRVLRIFQYSAGCMRATGTVEALPGDACRVTVLLTKRWSSHPGQYAYLYMPKLGFWQSHPFSVAWTDDADHGNRDRSATHRHNSASDMKIHASFIVRARAGFTNKLYQHAIAAPRGRVSTACLVEGPYGTKHSLESYGSVVLFAGGVGITHHIPYVKNLIAGFSTAIVATRKVLLVWSMQSPEHLEWIRPWMTEILGMEGQRDVLRIMLFVTQLRLTQETPSLLSSLQVFTGRPNIERILSMEQEQQIGAMAVSVCGPGTLSDDVRLAVRRRQSHSSIDFVEEAFSW